MLTLASCLCFFRVSFPDVLNLNHLVDQVSTDPSEETTSNGPTEDTSDEGEEINK